jgi:hypothetical protein
MFRRIRVQIDRPPLRSVIVRTPTELVRTWLEGLEAAFLPKDVELALVRRARDHLADRGTATAA